MQGSKFLGLTLLLIGVLPATAGEERLTGTDSGRTPAFSIDAPWLLEWTTTSEYPQLASIEIRLYDADDVDRYQQRFREIIDGRVERVDACVVNQATHRVHLFRAETLSDQGGTIDETK